MKKPKKGKIYNLGGGRKNSCSIIEVINYFKLKDKKLNYKILKFSKSLNKIIYVVNLKYAAGLYRSRSV